MSVFSQGRGQVRGIQCVWILVSYSGVNVFPSSPRALSCNSDAIELRLERSCRTRSCEFISLSVDIVYVAVVVVGEAIPSVSPNLRWARQIGRPLSTSYLAEIA